MNHCMVVIVIMYRDLMDHLDHLVTLESVEMMEIQELMAHPDQQDLE